MQEKQQHIELIKWIKGELSNEEIMLLEKDYDLNFLKENLEKVDHFEFPNYDIEKAFEKLLLEKRKTQTKQSKKYLWIVKVAASILVLLIPTWYFFFSNNQIIISTKFAEEKTIVLPDSSLVLLNTASEIIYSEKEWNTDRRVTVKGEAFFKVKKGSVFTVLTKQGSIQVLGTQFNVFNRLKALQVNCFEGKVKVKTANSENILTQGKGIVLKNGKIELINHKLSKPYWQSGKMSFRNTSLKEVFEEIKRQYNYKIITKDINTTREFTGILPNNNISKALAILSKTMEIKFEINDNTIFLTSNSQ